MGGLHAGHLSLIDIAKKNSKLVVVSIFLNPAQFGKNEDLDSYPQSLKADILQLQEKKVDVLFAPNISEIYPKNYTLEYDIGYLGTILCAKSRPQFFPGIVKVVYRLFDIIKPSVAVFGKKDYQQFLIIKQLVHDFNLNITVLSGELIREESGLALSTRNNYLDTDSKQVAITISQSLKFAKSRLQNDENIDSVKSDLTSQLQKYFTLDYCEILDSKNLRKIDEKTQSLIILVATLGKIRLIDNIEIHNWRKNV